jgi:hypothetical protein
MKSGYKLLNLLALSVLLTGITRAQSIKISDGISLPPLSISQSHLKSGLCSVASANINPVAKTGNKAYSTPISEIQIQFRTTAQDGQPVTLRVQEGAMAKIIAFKEGAGYALIPTLSGVNNEWIDVRVYKLNVDPKGNETIAELGQFTAKPHELAGMPSVPALQIELVEITQPSSASNKRSTKQQKTEPLVAFASADKTDCCVTC